MTGWKRAGSFIGLLLLVAAGVILLFWNGWKESGSVLLHGEGQDSYLLIAGNTHVNGVCALGRSDGAYRLVMGSETGKRQATWKISDEVVPQESRPASLYLSIDGSVYLGLYNTEARDTTLEVYRITEKGKKAELLLSEPCPGTGLQQQMQNVRLSAFSVVNNAVIFAVLNGDTASFYQYNGPASGLRALRTAETPGLRNAVALSDSRLVLVTKNAFLPVGGEAVTLPQGQTIEQVVQSGTGLYYVEGSTLSVCHLNMLTGATYEATSLVKDDYKISRCTALCLGEGGESFLLLDGRQLLVDYGSVLSDVSGLLHRTASLSVLTFVLGAVGTLLLTGIFWFLLCEERRLYLPLLLRWGGLTVIVALLGLGILVRFQVSPACEQAAYREATTRIGGLLLQVQESGTLADQTLPDSIGVMLGGNENSVYGDAAVTLFTRDTGGNWYVTATNGPLSPGTRGELTPAFNRNKIVKAWQDGSCSWRYEDGSATRYVTCQADGSCVLCVDVDGSLLLETSRENGQWMLRQGAAFSGLFVFLALLSLFCITRELRRVAAGMEDLAEGNFEQSVAVTSPDELGALANGLNALSDTLKRAGQEQAALARSYHRFVPERVLSLLEKESILEVDKQTFVSRNLAAMMLCFEFAPEIYEKSGRELFDNINEIIERTAPIVTRKGGTVFNFAYNGYDAVFEGGSVVAVSTAVEVRQEVLEINRERRAAGRPPVSVRIALDEGSVMIGVVGDESQIEVSSISASFSVARHLLELCQKLQASILCTETVISGAGSYGSRYMGLCTEGGEQLRTYEIFDGDPYEIRKRKEASGVQFSEGVYALYGRDFSRAKRIFLDLVHRNAGDGGARYYLYLADRLEKRTDEAISLDANVT